jgi:hypothetical protein
VTIKKRSEGAHAAVAATHEGSVEARVFRKSKFEFKAQIGPEIGPWVWVEVRPVALIAAPRDSAWRIASIDRPAASTRLTAIPQWREYL